METVKHKFLLLENAIDPNKTKIENIHIFHENFQSICSVLFPENQDACKNLNGFWQQIQKDAEHKDNPNLITIDLTEKVKTRNQRKGSSGLLRENKKMQNCQNSTSDENFEDISESKDSKHRKKFNLDDEDYKPAKEIDFEEEYSDFENKLTNRKRKVKQ